jgi:hypothetical protein
MSLADGNQVSLERFTTMTELAGLGMTAQEIEELKPLYDLYARYVGIVHSVEFGAVEIGVTFHPDWPSA